MSPILCTLLIMADSSTCSIIYLSISQLQAAIVTERLGHDGMHLASDVPHVKEGKVDALESLKDITGTLGIESTDATHNEERAGFKFLKTLRGAAAGFRSGVSLEQDNKDNLENNEVDTEEEPKSTDREEELIPCEFVATAFTQCYQNMYDGSTVEAFQCLDCYNDGWQQHVDAETSDTPCEEMSMFMKDAATSCLDSNSCSSTCKIELDSILYCSTSSIKCDSNVTTQPTVSPSADVAVVIPEVSAHNILEHR